MLEQSAVDDMNVETARIDPLDWDVPASGAAA